jgi:hypothetical protein
MHHAHEPAEPLPVLIAVASQSGRTVTPHAGRTRRFLLFAATADGLPLEAGRLDLPKAMALQGWPPGRAHPLHAFDAVVAASAGPGLRDRLGALGVRCVVTATEEPAAAAAEALLALRAV